MDALDEERLQNPRHGEFAIHPVDPRTRNIVPEPTPHSSLLRIVRRLFNCAEAGHFPCQAPVT